MQYIAIKEEEQNGKSTYIINALPLKNTNKAIVQKIPHPLGSDKLIFDTLEEAKGAIVRAGFAYILPNGQKGVNSGNNTAVKTHNIGYNEIVLGAIKAKINSSNANVAAAAIMAISEFPTEETFDILFEKIGEENDQIRKNAISGICRYVNLLQNRIIESLKSSNWVVRNSSLTCIQNAIEYGSIEIEPFLIPLTFSCDDTNTIVQANALITLANAYHEYQKQKSGRN